MTTKYIIKDTILLGYSDSPYSDGIEISDPPPEFNPLLQRCKRVNNQWVLETIDNTEYCKRLLRRERNRRLQETDWWAGKDVTMSQARKDYRQALRDLPSNASPKLDEQGNLTNVTWPTKPT